MKRKTTFSVLLLAILTFATIAHAQDYKISFNVENTSKAPDSIYLENLGTGENLMLMGSDTLHLVSNPTNLNEYNSNKKDLKVYPNPMDGMATLEFYTPYSGTVHMTAYTMTGQKVAAQTYDLPQGNTTWSLSGFMPGSYLVNMISENGQWSTVVLSTSTSTSAPRIDYLSTIKKDDARAEVQLKAAQIGKTVQMQYSDGNVIRLNAYSGTERALRLISPEANEDVDLKFFAYNTVSDVEGNTYNTLDFGTLTWMVENLKVTKYADGTPIPNITDNLEWQALDDYQTDKGYCFYNNDASLGYGALYNFAAASNDDNSGSHVQGICPAGWHLPSDYEWKILEKHLGMSQEEVDKTGSRADIDEGEQLKTTTGWTPNYGTNTSGFSALPGGWRSLYDGTFQKMNTHGYWWSSTEVHSGASIYRELYTYSKAIMREHNNTKSSGLSVRCVKNNFEDLTVPSISSVGAISITSSSAFLGGNINETGGTEITTRGIEYSLSQNFVEGTGEKLTDSHPGQGEYNIKLSTLQSETSYYFRAYASNEIGTTYGEELQFTTTALISVTDIEGNIYSTATIGIQTWMTENLKTGTYANGTTIPTNVVFWSYNGNNDTDKAYCFNYSDESLGYGALYTYAAASNGDNSGINVQGICPNGWHLPSDTEWSLLENYLADNGYNYDGTTHGGGGSRIAKALASQTGWDSDAKIGSVGSTPSSNNTSGFSALPGGFRWAEENTFNGIGDQAIWWCSTQLSSTEAYQRGLLNNWPNVFHFSSSKSRGISVRCVKNDALNGIPSIVNSVDASTITSSSAVLNGIVIDNGGTPITERGIEFSIHHFSLSHGTLAPAPTTGMGEFSIEFSSLDAGSTFYFRAYATNTAGTSYGEELTFTTTVDD